VCRAKSPRNELLQTVKSAHHRIIASMSGKMSGAKSFALFIEMACGNHLSGRNLSAG
jgi:hypothetical protein